MKQKTSGSDLSCSGAPKEECDWATAFRLSETHKTIFIDLRHPAELPEWKLPLACISSSELAQQALDFGAYDYVFVFCYHGISSLQATRYLSSETGHPGIRSVQGGAELLPNYQE